ncbi:uncharacterized protein LOC110455589, partial [Mizuhopecten yessoensis]|uniref:uncharacterized protein LOC110455589 n=1 Tax=Mizuhopecten yessoensis TaxID=6573 RepID=UPI000B45D0EA
MTVLNTSPALKGRLTGLAHALFVCFTLIRLIGLLYIIVGTVLIVKDGVLQHATFPLLNQFVVHGMPLGNLSSGLVYGLFFMLILHTNFGCLGLLGVVCHKKLLVIIYNAFLMFGIVTDAIFILLFSLIIDGINSWIKDRFLAYYDDFSASRLNTEVEQAFRELFDAMDCNGAVGSDGGAGCWDKYYPVMNGILRVFIMLLSFSIVLQVTTMVLLEIIYRRLGQPKHKRSPGMYVQFFRFVRTSCQTSKTKCVFAVIQFADVVSYKICRC